MGVKCPGGGWLAELTIEPAMLRPYLVLGILYTLVGCDVDVHQV